MYDLEKLLTELPTHPRQQGIKWLHELKAQRYWDERNRKTMTIPSEEPNDWVTIVHACHMFGVSDQTIRRWVKTANIETKKVKGRVLVDKVALEFWYRTWNGNVANTITN